MGLGEIRLGEMGQNRRNWRRTCLSMSEHVKSQSRQRPVFHSTRDRTVIRSS